MTSLGFTQPDLSELWIHADGAIVRVEAVTATSILFVNGAGGFVWAPLARFLADFRFYDTAETE